MPIESNLTIVSPTGAVIWQADGSGARDGSNRQAIFIKSIHRELLAASVDNFVWTCREGVWQVQYVTVAIQTAGGSGASVDVKYSGQTATAVASGTTQLSAAIVLTTTGPAMNWGTVIAAPTNIYPGDSLGLDFSGTLTALIANITITLKRTV